MNPAAAVLLGSLAALAMTWIGYPAAMLALGRRTSRPGAPPPRAPGGAQVSVVLASREEPGAVEARVRDLLAGGGPAPEIVVADDRGEAALYRLPEPVRVVRADGGGKPGALNAAARAARGEVLVFGDVHQRFAPGAIGALAAALNDPSLGAVSGTLELPPGAPGPIRAYWALESRLREAEARVHSTIGVTGAIYAMRRALWEPLPPGLLLDDLYVPMRLVLAGHRVGFEPEARAVEVRVHGPQQEFRRKVRTLTGNFQLCAWLPAVLHPGRNPVWLQFVCHKLLRLATPWLALAAVVSAALVLAPRVPSPSTLTLAALGILALWAAGSPDPLARALRQGIRWGGAMLAAGAVATVHGLRGKWDVWQPTR